MLKCRPPANRDPLPGEIDACRDYLDEQIDLIDPLVIVTLGRFSMAKFFPNQAISRIHGRPRETAGMFYVPMYHPAAALHQGNLRDVMLNDFRQLPALLERARSGRAGPTLTLREEPAMHDVQTTNAPDDDSTMPATNDGAPTQPTQIPLL